MIESNVKLYIQWSKKGPDKKQKLELFPKNVLGKRGNTKNIS
jgi:hypothetical protein